MSFRRIAPLPLFVITFILILTLAAFSPAEKTLGEAVRLVYLHGAWVWSALIGFVAAALLGLAGLLTRRELLHRWSRALGRTALLFWITFIPMSMVAAQFNWNGLFLIEPRWRMAFALSLSGLLLQIGVSLLPQLAWNSLANVAYALVAFYLVGGVQNVMHPESPIRASDSSAIQAYALALLALTLFLAWQVACWWLRRDLARHPLVSE